MSAHQMELLRTYIRDCDSLVIKRQGRFVTMYVCTGVATIGIRLWSRD